MCIKLSSEDLNSSLYPPHPTSTYTCGVTIALRVCDDNLLLSTLISKVSSKFLDLCIRLTHISCRLLELA